MLDTLYNLLEQHGTWPVVALIFVLFFLCAQGFEFRRKKLGFQNQPLDSRGWYTPKEAQVFFENIGQSGRNLYASTQLTLDILFPILYGALFSIFLIHVYSRGTATNLLLVPLVTVVADLLENVTTACLALQFDGQESSVTRVATIFTVVKLALFGLSLLLILIGALFTILRPR